MKVAFATQDRERVDAHFGWAKHIAVYEVTARSASYLETFVFGGKLDEDGDEDKLAPKLEALQGVSIVYVAAIGGSAAARVVNAKIHPVKVNQPELIMDILEKLQDVLKGTPPPWLRKVMLKDQAREFDFEDEA